MSEQPVTPAERALRRDPFGAAFIAASVLLAFSGLAFVDLRWLLGFAAITFAFGMISASARAGHAPG